MGAAPLPTGVLPQVRGGAYADPGSVGGIEMSLLQLGWDDSLMASFVWTCAGTPQSAVFPRESGILRRGRAESERAGWSETRRRDPGIR